MKSGYFNKHQIMKKVLSQEEIDALLSSASVMTETEEVSSLRGSLRKSIQVYDFKHPERINKEQLRTLRTIHDNFARMLATYLSTTLRSMIDVDFNSIDQVTFNEYALSLAIPNALYTLDLENLEGKAILEISPQLVLYMVDRLLGGLGESENKTREITVIEQNVVKRIVDKMLQLLNDAWSQIHEIGARIHSFDSDPQFVQIARSTETLAIIFFEIRIRGQTYILNISIPYYSLEPILMKLSAQSMLAGSARKEDTSRSHLISEGLRATKLPIRVVLAETSMKVKEFIGLANDDLLELEQKTSRPLLVHIGGRALYFGSPGTSGRKKAVKIIRKITPEEKVVFN